MSKKIVAIGGGNIGELDSFGNKYPYETRPMDESIIKLSDSTKPNILFIGLADPKYSKLYYEDFKSVYTKNFNCVCDHLDLETLINKEKTINIFDWADIFYIGGGNTYTLISIIKKYGLDILLLEAYNQGKVMSGLSAGGMCWFKYGNSVIPYSDSPKQLIKQECLGFIDSVFVPHCDEINGHFENVENLLANERMVAISLSNCCAIEIVDDKYRLISADSSRYKIYPFGIKSYFYNGCYVTEDIPIENTYKNLESLLTPSLNDNPVKPEVKQLLRRRNIYFK